MNDSTKYCKIEIRIKAEGHKGKVLGLKRDIEDSVSQFKGLTSNLKIQMDVDKISGFE